MRLTVNGKPREVTEGRTVGGLIEDLELNPEIVNIQLNGKVLEKKDFDRTALSSGDNLEILMFLGGGSSSWGLPGGKSH